MKKHTQKPFFNFVLVGFLGIILVGTFALLSLSNTQLKGLVIEDDGDIGGGSGDPIIVIPTPVEDEVIPGTLAGCFTLDFALDSSYGTCSAFRYDIGKKEIISVQKTREENGVAYCDVVVDVEFVLYTVYTHNEAFEYTTRTSDPILYLDYMVNDGFFVDREQYHVSYNEFILTRLLATGYSGFATYALHLNENSVLAAADPITTPYGELTVNGVDVIGAEFVCQEVETYPIGDYTFETITNTIGVEAKTDYTASEATYNLVTQINTFIVENDVGVTNLPLVYANAPPGQPGATQISQGALATNKISCILKPNVSVIYAPLKIQYAWIDVWAYDTLFNDPHVNFNLNPAQNINRVVGWQVQNQAIQAHFRVTLEVAVSADFTFRSTDYTGDLYPALFMNDVFGVDFLGGESGTLLIPDIEVSWFQKLLYWIQQNWWWIALVAGGVLVIYISYPIIINRISINNALKRQNQHRK